MTPDELLTAYDDQLRTDAEVARATSVGRDGPVLRAVFDHGGFVSYRDLGGLDGAALDDHQLRVRGQRARCAVGEGDPAAPARAGAEPRPREAGHVHLARELPRP